MIKVAISDEATRNALLLYNVYDKEIEFYGEIASKINKKVQQLGETQMLAKCFGVCKEKKIIILENLAVNQFLEEKKKTIFCIFYRI